MSLKSMQKNIKKRNSAKEPHAIMLDNHYGPRLYRQRLVRDEGGAHKNKAEETVDVVPEGTQQILGIANILNQLWGDLIIKHPRYDLKFVVNRLVGPEAAYLLSGGEFSEYQLEMILQYIAQGDRVVDIGAGLGITTTMLSVLSGQPVLAVEPNERLHAVIRKNSDLNKAHVDLLEGCVVAGQKSGEVPFYVCQEYLSSSLFAYEGKDVEHIVNVRVYAIDELIKRHQANALAIDAQGAEIGLFEDVCFDGLEKMIVSIDSKFVNERGIAAIIARITQQGFFLRDICKGVYVFLRT